MLSETPAPSTESPTPPVPIVGASFGSWATSLAPEILGLNLQLQLFVELMRTGHATSSLSTPSTPTSSVNGGATTEDAGMTSSITSLASSTASTSLLSAAIHSSQALLSSIQSLPPSKAKESWERECVDVCGLLAYKDLTNCPVRGYLETSRRQGLADMVNSAILRKCLRVAFLVSFSRPVPDDLNVFCISLSFSRHTERTNRTPLPLIELAARSATALWSTLGEMKYSFPPGPTATVVSQSLNGTTKTKVAKVSPIVPPPPFPPPRIPRRSVELTQGTLAGADVSDF